MNYNKHTALRLEWSEVGPIASKAIADIIGRSITCVGKRDDETYWEIQFVDYQMPLSEKFKILERIGVAKEQQKSTNRLSQPACLWRRQRSYYAML